MHAFDLKGRLANIDAHVADPHALLALDALVAFVAIVYQQSIVVAQNPLQIAIRADRSAKPLAHQGEIEKSDERNGGARDAARRMHVERQQPLQQVAGRDEIRDEDKCQKDRNRGQHG